MPPIGPVAIADSDTFFRDCPIAAQVFTHRAKIMRVKDGDSCVAWIDDGDGVMVAIPIRYEHVNCPELSQAGGAAARDFNNALVTGKWAVVKTRKRRDQYGRMLADVFTWDAGTLIDVTKGIVAAGHGVMR